MNDYLFENGTKPTMLAKEKIAELILQDLAHQQLLALLAERLPDERKLIALVAMHALLQTRGEGYKPSDLATHAVGTADYLLAKLAEVKR